VIAKGEAERVRARGLDAFRAEVARLAPFARDRVDELASWEDVKLLTVRVQRRREWPTRVTQWLQLQVQRRVIGPVLGGSRRPAPPLVVRALARWPRLRRVPGRLVGLGIRPEHVRLDP